MTASKRRQSISQTALFEQIGYAPHPGQVDILTCPVRNQVAACGRRFGKSDIGGHKLVPEAYRAYFRKQELDDAGKRMEFWIVGPEYSDAEKEFRVVYDVLKKLEMPFDKPGTYNDPIGGNLHISLWGGKYQVHGKSAKYPDSLVGEGLHGVVLSEAAKLKERIWTKYIRPTLADFQGWSFMGSTPEGKNWFHQLWQKGQDPDDPEWASWRRPSWMNPHVYKTPTVFADVLRAQKLMTSRPRPENVRELLSLLTIDDEVMSLLNDLSVPAFNQEIGAMFNEFVGRVFGEFDEEVHVGSLPYQPSWETYAAVDYGFTNPNVWLLLQVGPWGEINILDELYESGLTPQEFADRIKADGLAPGGLLRFYPDPAAPGDTRVLENTLRVKGMGGTGGELKHRLDAIRRALKPMVPHDPASRPQLMFDRRCTATIRDFNEYRYPKSKDEQDANSPENPMKKDDHAPEALGRFFAGHMGTPAKDARRARVRAANLNG